MKYDKQYFIDKVKALKEENFKIGTMGVDGCHCMLGHCGVKNDWKHTEESIALTKLMNKHFTPPQDNLVTLSNPVMKFNDNKTVSGRRRQGWLDKLKTL